MSVVINFHLTSTTREGIRRELITEFLKEQPGTGTGENSSKYIYFVETLQDGNRIYLQRPARFNKGFDFGVNVENTYFGTNQRVTMPKHQDIYDDLSLKKTESEKEFERLVDLITKVFGCHFVTDEEIRSLNFTQGYSVELILKCIKWLFIEQDITYWNWSGRYKLYEYISELW